MKKLASVVITGCLLAACAPDGELSETKVKLAEANKKIAELEKELGRKSTAYTGDTAPVPGLPKTTLPPPPAVEPPLVPTGQQWQYDLNEDPMSGSKRYTASIQSTNTVSFGFPYAGEQHGTLTVRSIQGKGKDILFYIERGQMLCPSYEGCSVQVRFDDEKPIRFAANGPADHSTELLFLSDYSKFMAKMKKAKRVRISANIYQNGAPAFEFDVSGFSADKYQPKG